MNDVKSRVIMACDGNSMLQSLIGGLSQISRYQDRSQFDGMQWNGWTSHDRPPENAFDVTWGRWR